MSLLAVGSVALDTIETPFGEAIDCLGGSATFFSAAASFFAPVRLVGVVGEDFPRQELAFLERRGVDLAAVETRAGESFRWSGVYSHDLNSRETRETRLGVFADFAPLIPPALRDSRFVFLGNIDPVLQLDVLDQIDRPELVACDTMNYWIEGRRAELERLLTRIDLLLINDTEARELSGEVNVLKAARWIQARGPRMIVVKKGEHGAILFTDDVIFFAPGYPLEEVFDPTGAGDAFAGGFIGSLARAGRLDAEDLRRAVVYGSTLGSFAVERFGVRRLIDLTPGEIDRRVSRFHELTAFEQPVAIGAGA